MSTRSWFARYLNSSIGKKQLMGITGLMLCGFLLTHLLGNLLMYVSSDAFNLYAYKLTSNPLIYALETVLGLIFLAHIALAIRLILENKRARPEPYYMKVRTGRGTTFASNTMPYTGMIGLIFLVIHILNFRLATVMGTDVSMAMVDGIEMTDLYSLVIQHFLNPMNVGIYLIGVIALGIHVSHGFQSAFQSLGVNHPKYTPCIQKLSLYYALFITIGFSSLPIWAYLTGGNL